MEGWEGRKRKGGGGEKGREEERKGRGVGEKGWRGGREGKGREQNKGQRKQAILKAISHMCNIHGSNCTFTITNSLDCCSAIALTSERDSAIQGGV